MIGKLFILPKLNKSKQLISLKNGNPREYWKTINSYKKPTEAQTLLSNFYEFFNSINECSENDDLDISNESDEATDDEIN